MKMDSKESRFSVSDCNIESIILVEGQEIEQKPDDELMKKYKEEEQMESAKEELKKAQRDYHSNFEVFWFNFPNRRKIPTVFPSIIQFKMTPTEHDRVLPGDHEQDYNERVSYKKLCDLVIEQKYVCLYGAPGSGKTTLARRMVKDLDKEICFLITVSSINYTKEKKLTLRELLLDRLYPKLDSKTCADAFKWIVKNDDKCAIILDGYEEAEWRIDKSPTNEDYETKLPISHLIASLCTKQFLPNSCLFITTRPHRYSEIPRGGLRSLLPLGLQDLEQRDVKKLLLAFAQTKADKVWEILDKNVPQLKEVCLNPLILQLFTEASLRFLDKIDEISTVTRIFSIVLFNMRHCDNMSHPNAASLTNHLARLAYKLFSTNTQTLDRQDLEEEDLDIQEVHDFILPVDEFNPFGDSTADTSFKFSHKTFQDYFLALYMVNEMPFSEFQEILKEVFTNEWQIVRTYLCGLLVDINKDDFSVQSLWNSFTQKIFGADDKRSDTSRKKSVLLNELQNKLRSNPDQRELSLLCQDIRECNNDMVASETAKCLPSVVNFFNTPLDGRNAQSIGFVLRKVCTKLKQLLMWNCNLQSSSFILICEAIKMMPGSIGVLDLRFNYLSTDDIDRLGEIVDKIEDVLWIYEAFSDEMGRKRSINDKERVRLQNFLNDSNNKNLRILVGYKAGEQDCLKKEN